MTIREITTTTEPDPATNVLDALRAQSEAAAAEFARRFDAGDFVWNDDDTLTVLR